jgi:hypothetical protein
MQNISKGSSQKIELNVYNDDILTHADSTPRVSVYNADTDVAIAQNIAATNGVEAGSYYFNLNQQFTNVNATLQVVWSYSLNSVSIQEEQWYRVESPYSTVSEIQDFLNFGQTPADLNYKDPERIVAAEKVARTIIEGYTGQKFYTYHGTQEVVGVGSDACHVTERMLSIEKVWENDQLLIDNTSDPVYNNFGFPLEISPTGYAVRIVNAGWDVRYDNQVDPAVLYYGRFRDNSRYRFEGQIGYKYVPEDIKVASMLLVSDILANDFNWRNKYLKKVDLSEISFEMAGGAFNGTGNVTVDNILDQYRTTNIVII